MTRTIGVVALALTLLLAACGGDDNDEPTPVPTTGSTTTTVGGGSTPGAGGAPSQMTIGELAQIVSGTWTRTSYERVDTSGPASGGTPAAGAGAIVTVNDVVYPDRARQTVTIGGQPSVELVFANGAFFARGPLVDAVLSPGVGADAWISLDPNAAGTDSVVANLARQLGGLMLPRLSDLSPDELAREVTLAGTITVNGRVCTQYQTVDTTMTGERQDILIALDNDNRLCSVTTRAGGQETTEVYSFDVPLTIEAPAGAGTPTAASPAATPASAATPTS